jgi:RimJ/RimL family protein N-acetyltransferase
LVGGEALAAEAARLGVDFGFQALGLRLIEADPAVDNIAAHSVLEKVGMRRLEVRRGHHLPPSGGLRDSVRFAIDRESFPV